MIQERDEKRSKNCLMELGIYKRLEHLQVARRIKRDLKGGGEGTLRNMTEFEACPTQYNQPRHIYKLPLK